MHGGWRVLAYSARSEWSRLDEQYNDIDIDSSDPNASEAECEVAAVECAAAQRCGERDGIRYRVALSVRSFERSSRHQVHDGGPQEGPLIGARDAS